MRKQHQQKVVKEILGITKNRLKQDQIKKEINIAQQKLNQLKNRKNPQLLQRIKQLQKQINRLQILTIDNGKSQQLFKQLIKADSRMSEQNGNRLNSNLLKSQASNEENLQMLKNVTTKNYTNQSSHLVNNLNINIQANNQIKPISRQQFSFNDFISQLQQKTAPNVMETQIYPLLNRYLTAKSSLLAKIIQINPQKRHNNSLLIPHQRVMLKQHLDITRRIIDDLDKKSQELQQQLNKDFIVIKNKWEESQRELIRLSNQ